MKRRSFLQCVALSGLAVTLPWQDAVGWRVDGQVTQPGARLRVRVSPGLQEAAVLVVEVSHVRAGTVVAQTQHDAQPVVPGADLVVVTPYPYTHLVAGDFAVRLLLQHPDGHLIDAHDAGTYHVRRFRFSA